MIRALLLACLCAAPAAAQTLPEAVSDPARSENEEYLDQQVRKERIIRTVSEAAIVSSMTAVLGSTPTPLTAIYVQKAGDSMTGSLYILNFSSIGIRTSQAFAPLQVGAGNINNSSDAQILISRNVDNSVPGNGHAFSDSSIISRAGQIGYNSYDARVIHSGGAHFNHYAGFQDGMTYSSTGTLDNLYGFYSGPTITTGIVTTRYGAYVDDIVMSNAAVSTNYGIYIHPFTVGTTKYGLYSDGANNVNYFAGNVGIGTILPFAPLHVGDSNINNSSDAQILVSRNVNNTVAGNGHAFSDSSTISRAGSIGYNSFDARTIHTAGAAMNHYTAFQDGMTYSSTGTIGNIYGLVSAPTFTTGTITTRYGLYVADPVVSNSTFSTNYGVYIEPFVNGINKWGIYQDGAQAVNYFGGNVGIGTNIPYAPLQVGNGNLNNSSDSQILISRNVNNTVSGNGHAFSDSSLISRSGGIGYNSFDARVIYGGGAAMDHYAAFQDGMTYSSTGTLGNLYGFYSGPTVTTGTVTTRFGLYVDDVVFSNAAMSTNYGLYIHPFTVGTNKWGVYSDGAGNVNYFAGQVGIGNTSPLYGLDVSTSARIVNQLDVGGKAQITGSLTVKSTATIMGVTDGSNPCAGCLGEYIGQGATGNSAPAASGVYVNVTTITLTAGDWTINGTCAMQLGGTTAITQTFCGISPIANTVNTFGHNAVHILAAIPPASTEQYVPVGPYDISITVQTVYYLIAAITYSVGGGAYWEVDNNFLAARRVR